MKGSLLYPPYPASSPALPSGSSCRRQRPFYNPRSNPWGDVLGLHCSVLPTSPYHSSITHPTPHSAIFLPHHSMLHLHQPSGFILATHLLPYLASGSLHMLFPLLKTLSYFSLPPWGNSMFLEVSFTSSGNRSLVLLPQNPPVHSLVISDSL